MNVAALHLLKNREAKSSAEFFRLDETRRMGESGQDVAAMGGGDVCPGWGRSKVTALLVTVLLPLNRAASTAVATGAVGAVVVAVAAVVVPGPVCGIGAITGVAAPGAKRRGGSGGGAAFDRFDMLHACLGFALCLPGHLKITRSSWSAFWPACGSANG